jgi:hypothetical protein
MANNKDNQQTAKEVPMVYTPGSLRDVTLPSVRPFDMCGRILGWGFATNLPTTIAGMFISGDLREWQYWSLKKKMIGRIDEMDVVTSTTGAHSLRCQSTIGFGIGLSLYRHNIVIEPYGSFYL